MNQICENNEYVNILSFFFINVSPTKKVFTAAALRVEGIYFEGDAV